jgi:hypothetical protein
MESFYELSGSEKGTEKFRISKPGFVNQVAILVHRFIS